MVRLLRLATFIVFGGLALCLVQWSLADDAIKPVLEFMPQTDLTSLQSAENKATLSLQTENGQTALKIVGPAKSGYPGIHYAPAAPLDLSSAKGIETEITNLSDEPITISLRVENGTDPKAAKWSINWQQMEPGEKRTLQTPFGLKYGKPGYALDPAKIVGITVYVSGTSDNERTVLLQNICTFTQLTPQQPSDLAKPPKDGLVLWLDPSKASTVTADADRHIKALADRSGQHHDAKPAAADAAPVINPLELTGRPLMHFDTKCSLKIDTIRPESGGVTVFIVYNKVKGKQQSLPDGNLFVSRPQADIAPGTAPNFCIAVPSAKAPDKSLITVAMANAPIGPITLGEGFLGDIGEVLVYDHVFTSEGQRRKMFDYLQTKWGVSYDNPDPGWLRVGPLDPKPEYTHADLPLSDQANAGKWTLDPQFSDEFKGPDIDTNRYEVFCTDNGKTQWLGRAPGLFRPENVTFNNGLHIKLDKATPEQMQGHDGYKYTTGYIRTRQRTAYGYYEIEARPGKTAIDNAFWFADTGNPAKGLEIDVFELGPHTKYYHNQDIMTAHVWGENGDKYHWGWLVGYKAPFEMGDDFHVYGFQWTKDELIWYIDGSVVRKLKNTDWFLPQLLIFDAEPQVPWFGPVDDKDLPSEFTVKYLRVWRQQ